MAPNRSLQRLRTRPTISRRRCNLTSRKPSGSTEAQRVGEAVRTHEARICAWIPVKCSEVPPAIFRVPFSRRAALCEPVAGFVVPVAAQKSGRRSYCVMYDDIEADSRMSYGVIALPHFAPEQLRTEPAQPREPKTTPDVPLPSHHTASRARANVPSRPSESVRPESHIDSHASWDGSSLPLVAGRRAGRAGVDPLVVSTVEGCARGRGPCERRESAVGRVVTAPRRRLSER